MLIAAALAWTLAAFGGAYAWTLPPVYLLAAGAAALVRPRIASRHERLLDVALLAAVGAACLQLAPLAPAIRNVVSPHAAGLEAALRLDAANRSTDWHSLSVDPIDTLTWLPAGAAAVLLFWTTRGLFTTGHVRWMARAIAWVGLVAGLLVVIQHYSSPNLLYWTFRPVDPGGATAGPFVNRNHMATWLLLALPTTTGYLVTRAGARSIDQRPLAASVGALEEPATLWLAAGSAAMLAALITTQSRAGLIGLAVAGAAALIVARLAGRSVNPRWAALAILAALVVAAALASTGTLLTRFEQTGTDPVGGRLAIWRQSLAIAHDFALTGTGIGTYATAMLGYQQQAREGFFYNQAHDQYLQFAIEGGLLVGVPIVLAIVAFTTAAARALAADHSPMFWVRVGAAAGLVAVAVQSIWETGLRMPANALLAAVVAALAVYERRE